MAEDVDVTILDDVQFVSGQQTANLLKNFVQGIGLKNRSPAQRQFKQKRFSLQAGQTHFCTGFVQIILYTESSGANHGKKKSG